MFGAAASPQQERAVSDGSGNAKAKGTEEVFLKSKTKEDLSKVIPDTLPHIPLYTRREAHTRRDSAKIRARFGAESTFVCYYQSCKAEHT